MNENIPQSTDPLHEVPVRLSFAEKYEIHPLVFAFVSLAVIFFLYQIGGGLLTLLFSGSSVRVAGNAGAFRWAAVVGQLMFILVPTLVFAKLFSTNLRSVFPFRIPSAKEATLGLISLLALQRVFEVYQSLQDQVPVPNVLREFLEPFKRLLEGLVKELVHAGSIPELVFVLFVVAVVPAIIEECLFRGFIQKIFERLMSPFVSAVLAGTIFGLFHLNPFDIVPLIGLGVFLGLLRHRSQSLLLPISAHFLNNAMAVFAAYFGMEDDNLVAAAQSNPDIPTLVFQLIMFGGIFSLVFVAYLRSTRTIARGTHSE